MRNKANELSLFKNKRTAVVFAIWSIVCIVVFIILTTESITNAGFDALRISAIFFMVMILWTGPFALAGAYSLIGMRVMKNKENEDIYKAHKKITVIFGVISIISALIFFVLISVLLK